MVKMMVGGKLQEMVDKVTDQLEQAFNGKIPQEYNGYQNS